MFVFDPQYWFMFPISIVIATIAMSTGVGGAVFFAPIFLIGLKLAPPVAIGTALITEFFGFSSGLIAYFRQRLIDFKLGFSVLMFAVPAAIFGAAIADLFPADALKGIFAAGILFVGTQIFLAWRDERRHAEGEGDAQIEEGAPQHARHVVIDRTGRRFEYNVFNRPVAAAYASTGGMFLGMISVGLAELMEYQMVARCRIPAPVAVATSIFIVVIAVLAASVGHIVAFASEGDEVIGQVISLAIFTAPGVIIGGQLGPIVQRRVDPELMKVLISIVFVAVGLFMLISLAFL